MITRRNRASCWFHIVWLLLANYGSFVSSQFICDQKIVVDGGYPLSRPKLQGDGHPCIFPFLFKGRNRTRCLSVHSESTMPFLTPNDVTDLSYPINGGSIDYWCAIVPKYDVDDHTKKMWGFCNCVSNDDGATNSPSVDGGGEESPTSPPNPNPLGGGSGNGELNPEYQTVAPTGEIIPDRTDDLQYSGNLLFILGLSFAGIVFFGSSIFVSAKLYQNIKKRRSGVVSPRSREAKRQAMFPGNSTTKAKAFVTASVHSPSVTLEIVNPRKDSEPEPFAENEEENKIPIPYSSSSSYHQRHDSESLSPTKRPLIDQYGQASNDSYFESHESDNDDDNEEGYGDSMTPRPLPEIQKEHSEARDTNDVVIVEEQKASEEQEVQIKKIDIDSLNLKRSEQARFSSSSSSNNNNIDRIPSKKSINQKLSLEEKSATFSKQPVPTTNTWQSQTLNVKSWNTTNTSPVKAPSPLVKSASTQSPGTNRSVSKLQIPPVFSGTSSPSKITQNTSVPSTVGKVAANPVKRLNFDSIGANERPIPSKKLNIPDAFQNKSAPTPFSSSSSSSTATAKLTSKPPAPPLAIKTTTVTYNASIKQTNNATSVTGGVKKFSLPAPEISNPKPSSTSSSSSSPPPKKLSAIPLLQTSSSTNKTSSNGAGGGGAAAAAAAAISASNNGAAKSDIAKRLEGMMRGGPALASNSNNSNGGNSNSSSTNVVTIKESIPKPKPISSNVQANLAAKLAPSSSTNVTKKSSSSSSGKKMGEAELAKFGKMKKIGLSQDAIRHAIEKEGFEVGDFFSS